MNGGKYIGQLIFEPDGSKLPVDSKINGQINLYYHLADFKNIMDLLENSPTVSLLYVGSGNGNDNGIYAAARNIGPSNIRIISPVYTYSNPTVAPKSVETTSASMGNTGGILGNNTTIQPKI
jgi:histidinol-phosphate/aromatic aminotransferase/cobyric acid decarboxylase-like protein